MSPHTPRMSAERAQWIRRWHDAAHAAARREGTAEQTFDYLGRTIVVPPSVQPITGMSHLLGQAVLAEVHAGDRVLDMGTGSGVNAILAASAATSVLAVDISADAVAAAQANAVRNGVAAMVEARQSDVFEAVPGQFDLIIFDPPFRWFAPRDALEAATTDEDYRAMNRFFTEAGRHLSERGRMLIFFGTSGDLAYLRELIARHGFAAEVLAHDTLIRDGMTVDYFTYRCEPA